MKLIISLFLLLSSCAFKGENDSGGSGSGGVGGASGQSTSYPITAHIEWQDSGSNTIKKLERGVFAASSVFTVDKPVTLSESTPNEVTLYIDLPKSAESNRIHFLRSKIESDEKEWSIPSDLIEIKDNETGLDRVLIKLSAINSTLLRASKSKGTVRIDAYDPKEKIYSILLKIRTPPSQVTIESISRSQFKSQDQKTFERLHKIEAKGFQFNLLNVIQISNQDDEAVWTRFKKELSSDVSQSVYQYTYQDAGCVGAGFYNHKSGGLQKLTDRVFYVLLNSKTITELVELGSFPKSDLETVLELSPGETQFIGVFGIGVGANHWQEFGYKGSELSQIQVPGTCYQECVSYDCEPRCTCQHWETRRHPAHTTVGIERSPVTLNTPDPRRQIHFRFTDLDSKLDPEFRRAEVIPESLGLVW